MGCGCGGGRRNSITINHNNLNKKARIITLRCPKCNSGSMLLSQRYSPQSKKYIKHWKCNKCNYNMQGT